MKKKWILLGILPITVSLGAWVYYGIVKKNRVVLHPKKGPIAEAIYGLGTVMAHKSYTLKIGVPSAVKKLYVYEGMTVQKNDPLISFEESPGIIHKAPFAGVISKLNFKQQETVFPQAPILTLIDLQDRYISVSVEQSAALRVKPGQLAHISFEGVVNESFLGKVLSIYPQESQFLVHIASMELPEQILPGMTSDIAIEVGRKDNVMVIPLVTLNKGKINLYRNGKKQAVAVKLGIVDGEWAELVSGDVRLEDELLVSGP